MTESDLSPAEKELVILFRKLSGHADLEASVVGQVKALVEAAEKLEESALETTAEEARDPNPARYALSLLYERLELEIRTARIQWHRQYVAQRARQKYRAQQAWLSAPESTGQD